MIPPRIRFGTDGWRAIIAEDFTFANLERVAQATADVWNSAKVPGTVNEIVVGFDRRFLSDLFAARVARVFAANGFKVCLASEPTPTPAISLAITRRHATGGVIITASHNPAVFNGYKLKEWFGGPADPAFCKAVESRIDASPVRSFPSSDKAISRRIVTCDLRTPHLAALHKLVDFARIAGSGLRVAHDALYGVGAGCFEQLLADTSCSVTTLNREHDPNFGGINPEPVAQNYIRSAAWLAKHPQDICIVTDGDADRVGGMMGDGKLLSTHQINALLLHHFFVNRHMQGRVVRSLTVTSMIDKMCTRFGLPVVETPVGFKHITAEMLKGDVLLGFEESGGIGFPGYIPERDGIAAGLLLLELLAYERKPLWRLVQQLEKDYGRYQFGRLDISFPLERRAELMERCEKRPPKTLLGSRLEKIQAFDGVKFTAENGSWLMLRASGTEPILRIYAEAPTLDEADSLLKIGVRFTRL